MELHSLLAEAIRFYEAAGLNCAQKLLPPTDDYSIDVIATELSVPVPPELRKLYHVYGGQEYIIPGITGLFGSHRLHSPAEVVEKHVEFTTVFGSTGLLDSLPVFPPARGEWGYWVPELLPFASWDAYDLCVHASRGDVWEFNPGTGLIGPWPSISAALEEVLAVLVATGEPNFKFYSGAE
ncbi:MAG TPA: SMI1/KNR4 family protein [Pirellulales bacterium]|nr:SMI1/KNR4 family protein [Pirellulales bacterium]